MIHSEEYYMQRAFRMAEQAFEEEEVPIGAVIVSSNRIIGKGYNQTERLNDPTAHAEIIAITAACNYLDSKYLHDCTLFVTVEPCAMCAGAIRWAQIPYVVYGAPEPKVGFTLYTPPLLHPKARYKGGIMEVECRGLMQLFFDSIRS